MSQFQQALAILGGLFAFVAVLAVVFVYFRQSADKATIESQGRLLAALKDENADLTKRLEAVEQENAHLRRSVAQIQGIDILQQTVDAIRQDTTAIRAKVIAA